MLYEDWLKDGEYHQRANEQKIFCYQVGAQGSDILFLHGFPTSSFDWASIFEKLKRHGRLTSFDFLGFGASDKPNDHQYNYKEQTDIATEIIRKYDIRSCTLVAHDYGATVAQELLRRQASDSLNFRIEKVILLNGGIYHHLHRPALTQKLLLLPVVGPILARFFNRSLFEKAMAKLFVGKFKLTKFDAGELWQGIVRNNGQLISYKLLHYIPERKAHGHMWETAMEQCSIPLTLIWGMKDPISGKHVIEYAKNRLSDAKIVELLEVSHYPQIEAPDLVSQAILEVLSQ